MEYLHPSKYDIFIVLYNNSGRTMGQHSISRVVFHAKKLCLRIYYTVHSGLKDLQLD